MYEIREENAFYRYFEVEGNPIAKGRPRMTRSGHTYTPERTRQYEKLVRDSYLMEYEWASVATGYIKAEIRITVCIPKSATKREREELLKAPPMKRPDLDNVAKTILDALNGVAYEDDKQVTSLTIYRVWGDAPKAEIWLLGG